MSRFQIVFIIVFQVWKNNLIGVDKKTYLFVNFFPKIQGVTESFTFQLGNYLGFLFDHQTK